MCRRAIAAAKKNYLRCVSCPYIVDPCERRPLRLGPDDPKLAGLGDRASNLLDRMGSPVAGQIGSDKSAVARNHVAGGTAGIAVKQGFPAHRIAGQGGRFVDPLESTQISDDCLDVRTCKRMEGGHSSSGDTFLNDARQLSIRKPLHFAILGDVWSALSTATIQTVTACAGGSKNLLSCGIG